MRSIQENVITSSFDSLGLRAEILRATADQGYTQPTPIQAQSVPPILEGRDVLGAAQTGTGKTAGFALPLLQRLAAAPAASPRVIRALILEPTRELALQVEESVRAYGAHLPLTSTIVYGGVGMQPQIDALRTGVDILVATPGRLLDHAGEGTVDLSHVEILVLDEADRMLDMGFIHDIRRVLALLPAERQNLLFSATFSADIRALAGTFMRDAVSVEVARRNTPAELVSQVVHPVDAFRKRELLAHLVKGSDWRQVLVFVRTKHGANRLAHQLERAGVEADAIHGNKSQNARARALSRFKNGELRVLVATDIAARGLDIENLPHVVNYDLPHVPEDYIHRIGRTGRAGSEGEAVSLVCPEDRSLLSAIETLLRRTLESRVIAGFEPGAVPPPRQAGEETRQASPQDANPDGVAPRADGAAPEPRRRRRRGRRGRGGALQNAQHPGGQNPQHQPSQPPRPAQQQRPARDPQRSATYSTPRPDGRRPGARPDDYRVYADRDEREAQIREARMRLAAEGDGD